MIVLIVKFRRNRVNKGKGLISIQGRRHGSFSLTSHKVQLLGCFVWMKNSTNEEKRLWFETFHCRQYVDCVAMEVSTYADKKINET